jgi:hypothetical protein
MKSALFTAALLLGSASAGVHKLKLKKIPLSDQLVGYHTCCAADLSSSEAIAHIIFTGICQY